MSGLPLPDVLLQVIDCYFETINVWFPILHYSSVVVLLEDYDNISTEDAVLLHAITTATLRFVSKDILNIHDRKHQRELSLRTVKLYVLEHVSMRTLQALVILNIDAFGVDRMPGLLGLLRRQFDVLSAQSIDRSAHSECSSPSSMFDEQIFGSPSYDTQCLESVGRAVHLLEKYCYMITMTRSQGADNSHQVFGKSLTTVLLHSGLGDAECREDSTLREQSEALGLLSRVLTFGHESFSSFQAAAGKNWRRGYAALHRQLAHVVESNSDPGSRSSMSFDASDRGKITSNAIYFAGSIYLHSVAMHMFKDLNWDPELAIQQWRLAITGLSDLVAKLDPKCLSPSIAFCLWIACQASMCHSNFFESTTNFAIMSFIQALQDIGRSWNMAKPYADQAYESFRTMQAQLNNKLQTENARILMESICSEKVADKRKDSLMQTPQSMPSLEEEVSLFSCFDWAKFEIESGSDSGSSPGGSEQYTII